ncbi:MULTISPECIES: trypsin-like serine protease [Cysteiniphilum]|uniref:Peptidase S1 domain-containing protein n=1 Tax=Cysteiniphilum litorale TaxID=2056700 RepID=A0A8J2Z460_9GAMM|nr:MULTISPECIES: trypsin-like serine protease [Cysteiniphilum]GGF96402.1 hypothetical protein GCM10010995_12050 [Cysteiniphilum litorale]
MKKLSLLSCALSFPVLSFALTGTGVKKVEENTKAWAVEVYTMLPSTLLGTCSGSFISKHAILTASHCLRSDNHPDQVIDDYKIYYPNSDNPGAYFMISTYYADPTQSYDLSSKWSNYSTEKNDDVGIIFIPTEDQLKNMVHYSPYTVRYSSDGSSIYGQSALDKFLLSLSKQESIGLSSYFYDTNLSQGDNTMQLGHSSSDSSSAQGLWQVINPVVYASPNSVEVSQVNGSSQPGDSGSALLIGKDYDKLSAVTHSSGDFARISNKLSWIKYELMKRFPTQNDAQQFVDDSAATYALPGTMKLISFYNTIDKKTYLLYGPYYISIDFNNKTVSDVGYTHDLFKGILDKMITHIYQGENYLLIHTTDPKSNKPVNYIYNEKTHEITSSLIDYPDIVTNSNDERPQYNHSDVTFSYPLGSIYVSVDMTDSCNNSSINVSDYTYDGNNFSIKSNQDYVLNLALKSFLGSHTTNCAIIDDQMVNFGNENYVYYIQSNGRYTKIDLRNASIESDGQTLSSLFKGFTFPNKEEVGDIYNLYSFFNQK